MRSLIKNGSNGMYFKYYPSLPFLPSVVLGTLLTLNLVVGECSREFKEVSEFSE